MRLDAEVARRSSIAPALVMPYPVLENAGLRLLVGQLSLWVAGPSVGKSQLLANISHRSGEPTIYWSADTDRHDVLLRSIALRTGLKVDSLTERLDDDVQKDMLFGYLEQSRHIEWVFGSLITSREVLERLQAFAELRGEYPRLLVVDNLSNVVQSVEQELQEQKQVVTELQAIARVTKTHIAILAHAKGEYEDGHKPIPMGGVLNNLMKIPEVGVTLHLHPHQENVLNVNIVKNRNGGQSDQSAKRPVSMMIDYSTATVKGFRL